MQSSNNPENTNSNTPNTDPATPVTEAQKAEAVRDFLFKEFNDKYISLRQSLERAPLNADMKGNAVAFMHSGYMWAAEAFKTMSFAPPATSEKVQSNVVELPRKKRKYTMKKKNGKRRST